MLGVVVANWKRSHRHPVFQTIVELRNFPPPSRGRGLESLPVDRTGTTRRNLPQHWKSPKSRLYTAPFVHLLRAFGRQSNRTLKRRQQGSIHSLQFESRVHSLPSKRNGCA